MTTEQVTTNSMVRVPVLILNGFLGSGKTTLFKSPSLMLTGATDNAFWSPWARGPIFIGRMRPAPRTRAVPPSGMQA